MVFGENLKEKFKSELDDEDFFTQIAEKAYNNVYYLDESNQSARIEVGDYIKKPVLWNGEEEDTWIVAGLGTFNHIGDYDDVRGGILLMAEHGFGLKRICDHDDIDISWVNCKLRSDFGVIDGNTRCASKYQCDTIIGNEGLNYKLAKAFGTENLGYVRRYIGQIKSIKSCWNFKNWMVDYAFLPSEIEVYGHRVWSKYDDYNRYDSMMQFPIFSKFPQSRICIDKSGVRRIWWLCDVYNDDRGPSSFCYCNNDGSFYYSHLEPIESFEYTVRPFIYLSNSGKPSEYKLTCEKYNW